MCFSVAILRSILLAPVLMICLVGCLGGQMYFGHNATNLGTFSRGIDRADVEEVAGKPEHIESGEQGYKAFYIYDRGYVGTLEEQDTALKLAYVPLTAWGELLTFGLLGASLHHCQDVCQKGLLVVHYDMSDRVVTCEGDELPSDYPLLDGCAYDAPGSMISFCQGIRDRVRASTLPP
jgi:hypothetical protein